MCVKNTSINSNPQMRDELTLFWQFVQNYDVLLVMCPATYYTALKPNSETTSYAHEYTYSWLRIA